MNNLNEMIEKITDFLKNEVNTDTLIGKPFQVGEFSCVPIIRVGMGFGAGGGEGTDPKASGSGGGGGAGIGMEPIGFLVSRADEIHFIAASTSKGFSAAIEKLPDLLSKYMDSQKTASAEKN
ncbi:MAG: spore germination protein GerW family protein [Chitinophagales bacterium]|nr:spore germination protein GerW family protein [Chitinophagales bacterium]